MRVAERADLGAIVEIYNDYVRHSFATFDETEVSVEDGVGWFETFERTGPYRLLIAEDQGDVIGYACSVPYRRHVAFSETVEFSIYVSPGHVGHGIGASLYAHLLDELGQEPVHRIVVGIALPNDASVGLHRRFGFDDVGVFDDYAKKNGRYVSSLWMQRSLQLPVGRA